jgi:chromosome segregation ATPase
MTIELQSFTEIVRNNGWGKSNIADAISWILTGHLYDTSSDIESIKPKHNLKAVVSVELTLDNGTTLGKTYKENWVKTRGSNDYELKGHTTSYHFNGLEMTQTVYEERLISLYNIDKETYHLLLDPTYFGLKLEWKERRQIVNDLVGKITFNEIVASDTVFEKNFEATKKLNQLLTSFDEKIDLTKKSIIQTLNKFKKEEKELEAQIAGLNLITTTIDEATFNSYKLKDTEARTEIVLLKENVNIENTIKNLEAEIQYLRTKYIDLDRQVFTGVAPHEDNCPNCNYKLNAEDYKKKKLSYDQSLENFNSSKVKRLVEINNEGLNLKQKLDLLKVNKDGTVNGYKIDQLQKEIAAREETAATYIAWSSAQKKIKTVEETLVKVQKEITSYEMLSDLLGMYVSKLLVILNQRLTTIFGDIKFRLIEANIKEGSYNEVCDVLDKDVPYDRTNTASQIKIGVKLIEAIRRQKSYPKLPIIIDNAEAVVARDFNTDSQVICLIAGKETNNE